MAKPMEGECISSDSGLLNSVGACYHRLVDRLAARRWFLQAEKQGSKEAKRNLMNVLYF